MLTTQTNNTMLKENKKDASMHLRLTQQKKTELQRMSKLSGLTVSELIRRALDEK
jgi:16S rRNA U516 pseudouridylate synthase RsuA-like enzyme